MLQYGKKGFMKNIVALRTPSVELDMLMIMRSDMRSLCGMGGPPM